MLCRRVLRNAGSRGATPGPQISIAKLGGSSALSCQTKMTGLPSASGSHVNSPVGLTIPSIHGPWGAAQRAWHYLTSPSSLPQCVSVVDLQIPGRVPHQRICDRFLRAEAHVGVRKTVQRADEAFLERRLEREYARLDLNDVPEQRRTFGLSPAKQTHSGEIHLFTAHNRCHICRQ
jgi:hypothetical protein